LNTSDFIHTVYACPPCRSSKDELEEVDCEAAAGRGWILAIGEIDRELEEVECSALL
jgi:hypothetical protein